MQFTFKLNDVTVQDQVKIDKCEINYEINSEELDLIFANYPAIIRAITEVLTNMKSL